MRRMPAHRNRAGRPDHRDSHCRLAAPRAHPLGRRNVRVGGRRHRGHAQRPMGRATPSRGRIVVGESDVDSGTGHHERRYQSGGRALRLENRSGAAWCCGPTQVQIVAGAITAPPPAPTPTSPGADGFRSVRLDVNATASATASVLTVVVKVALSATVALEIPLTVRVQT